MGRLYCSLLLYIDTLDIGTLIPLLLKDLIKLFFLLVFFILFVFVIIDVLEELFIKYSCYFFKFVVVFDCDKNLLATFVFFDTEDDVLFIVVNGHKRHICYAIDLYLTDKLKIAFVALFVGQRIETISKILPFSLISGTMCGPRIRS